MSLAVLIELSKIKVDENCPAYKKRLEEFYVRMREFDKDLEQRIKNKQVSEELLNKTCSI